ncbi:MAG TPA: hypothetical protein VJ782_01570 [Aeromicrobium sp.]|nr:hypothetical protein [Aeromicrobium sp.]
MVAVIELSIDRTSLSAAPLVYTNEPGGNGWLDPDTAEPMFAFRYRYAPDSDLQPGSVLLGAVLEQSTLPAVIYLQAASTAALRVLKDELVEAVSQFAYDVTLTIDGDAQTFAADPVWPRWVTDSGMVEAHLARTALQIPVNPPGA